MFGRIITHNASTTTTTTMMWLFWFLLLAVSSSSSSSSLVSALDLRIKKVTCESRLVQFHFDYLCNGDYLCTFGEKESMEGELVYYGLVDQDDATATDSFIVNATLYFHWVGGYGTHQHELVTNLGMPLCHGDLVADESNDNGDCPNDGKYAFQTVYQMPQVDSPYLGWIASGWSGEVVVDIFMNSTMDQVGKCTLAVETLVTGSYEASAFKTTPSAKAVVYSVIGILGLCFAVCLCSCCTAGRRRRIREARKERLLADTDDESVEMKKDETILM